MSVDNDNDDQLGNNGFPPFMIIPGELAIKIGESLLALPDPSYDHVISTIWMMFAIADF